MQTNRLFLKKKKNDRRHVTHINAVTPIYIYWKTLCNCVYIIVEKFNDLLKKY